METEASGGPVFIEAPMEAGYGDRSPEVFQRALTLGQETPILSLFKACANSGPRNEPSSLGWVMIN